MVVLKTIYITIFLNAFCIHTGISSPVADPDPDVKVMVNINVNDEDSKDDSESEHGSCNVDCADWCYPSKDWPYTCPGFCNGQHQSPIDICSNSTIVETGSLTFSSSYSVPIANITINNNGHTVGVSWSSSLPVRTISGGGLTGTYTLAQFHFHWGCKDKRGSEHVVDGTRYAMELHLVHYKSSYGNLSNAIAYSDGLAVIGVFFNVGAANAVLAPIIKNLNHVVTYGHHSKKEIVFGKALIGLIPTTETFYRYQGSLTTPTCNEVVIWSVFSTPLSFSPEQVNAFRMLKDKHNNKMCDNYRGIQPLNGREVKKYQK